MGKLLPPDFDQRVRQAVQQFWTGRLNSAITTQEGGRGSVIAGKNLDGFSQLIRDVGLFCGIQPESVIVTGKSKLTIPGYFRPTKMWDALVVYNGHLVAGFELKSQVGPSFGNNFNNRSEESIGSAVDFWTAHRESAYRVPLVEEPNQLGDGKPPFLGYLMLLEDCEASKIPVRVDESHFEIFPEFSKSSYAKRYRLLIERLISEKWYTSGCLILSDREAGLRDGSFESPSNSLQPRSLFADFAAALLAAKETYS